MKKYSEQSGVNVIMGSGYYLQNFQSPDDLVDSEERQTERLIADFHRDGVRPGVIGEIGVSPNFTADEEKSLRAAARAQRELGVPLFIHMPGWQRVGHRILDIVLDDCAVDPASVVLCHMDPSCDDPTYQQELAHRGTYLCFDMIGMPYRFPGEGESPAPAQSAEAICALVTAGYEEKLLLSHDTFLKGMLTPYGGNGFGYVPFIFPARLRDRGLGEEQIMALFISNPARLFLHASLTNQD
ncbi:phosphotriesterase [Paeniglutamicibacter sp. MACA_103]|uniref:phosphotriesterase n=1 Tax=Paeniglutamicibacter sp. MACA_103 TaxID=3377337 RepID=UPI0038945DC7